MKHRDDTSRNLYKWLDTFQPGTEEHDAIWLELCFRKWRFLYGENAAKDMVNQLEKMQISSSTPGPMPPEQVQLELPTEE